MGCVFRGCYPRLHSVIAPRCGGGAPAGALTCSIPRLALRFARDAQFNREHRSLPRARLSFSLRLAPVRRRTRRHPIAQRIHPHPHQGAARGGENPGRRARAHGSVRDSIRRPGAGGVDGTAPATRRDAGAIRAGERLRGAGERCRGGTCAAGFGGAALRALDGAVSRRAQAAGRAGDSEVPRRRRGCGGVGVAGHGRARAGADHGARPDEETFLGVGDALWPRVARGDFPRAIEHARRLGCRAVDRARRAHETERRDGGEDRGRRFRRARDHHAIARLRRQRRGGVGGGQRAASRHGGGHAHGFVRARGCVPVLRQHAVRCVG